MPTSATGASLLSTATVWRLATTFGLLTFLQGVAEPTEGLVSQPVRSRVESLGATADQVTLFAALTSLPWIIKPVFGLLVDFFPFVRSRHRLALMIAGAVWGWSFLTLGLGNDHSRSTLLGWLILATLAAAIADVATDALVVEWGQARGMTGRFQSVVWFSSYAAGIATGSSGGALTQGRRVDLAYFCCAGAGLAMLLLTLVTVREPQATSSRPRWGDVRRTLALSIRSRSVWSVAGFVALWNFNPLTNPILQSHMTGALGLSEQLFGHALSVFSVAALVAAGAYGIYCKRVPMRRLAFASVALGVLANLAYAPMAGERSALAASAVVGFCYMTATLVQVDLASRACPPGGAATVFASLMAVSNLSTILAIWLGGRVYREVSEVWGRNAAFQVLIVVGALFTAAASLLIPFFPRSLLEEETAGTPA